MCLHSDSYGSIERITTVPDQIFHTGVSATLYTTTKINQIDSHARHNNTQFFLFSYNKTMTTATSQLQLSLNYMYKQRQLLHTKTQPTPTNYNTEMGKAIVCELMWRNNFSDFGELRLNVLLDSPSSPKALQQVFTNLTILQKQAGDIMFDETDFDFTKDCRITTADDIYKTAERIIQRKIASAPYTSLKGKFIDQACCVVFVTNNDESVRAVDTLVHANRSQKGIHVVNINELTESQKTELRAYGDTLPIIFIGNKQIKYEQLQDDDYRPTDYSIKDCTKSKSTF